MITVNRSGIARSAAKLGGEGTNLLLLKTSDRLEADALDACLPPDEEGPPNGGWFPGPRGWLLLIEGLDEQVNPWMDDLVTRLNEAGVEGTLTGGGSWAPPKWLQDIRATRQLQASIGFYPREGFKPWREWAPGPAGMDQVLDLSMAWLTAHTGYVVVGVDRASFKVSAGAATLLMKKDLLESGSSFCQSFNREQQETRHVSFRHAGLSLGLAVVDRSWLETVDELKTAITSAPLDQVSTASISHRDIQSLKSGAAGSEHYAPSAYGWSPQVWGRFVLAPAGIQILTDSHLAAAHDLTAWRTTRLDNDHTLVEARDLEPWYGQPRGPRDTVDDAVMDRARRDFGAMILTPLTAAELGIDKHPNART